MDGSPDQQKTQLQTWRPLLDEITAKHLNSCPIFIREASFNPEPQSKEIETQVRRLLSNFSAPKLAAIEMLSSHSKSLFLALYAIQGNDAEKFADAALVDYETQSKQWGSIEEYHKFNRSRLIETFYICRIFLTTPQGILEGENYN